MAEPSPGTRRPEPKPKPIGSLRIWDLPTRLFHWVLAATVAGAFITVKVGGSWMIWHSRLGYLALTLVLFRIVWGLAGGRHARFVNFVAGPAQILAYLRRPADSRGAAGHSPLGALAVLAMLGMLGTQAFIGLFAYDEIAFQGPLALRVSEALSLQLTGLHRQAEYPILALVALHLAAVAWYRLRHRQRLTRAMLTGDKPAASIATGAQPSRDDARLRWQGLAVLAACAALVAAVVSWGNT